MLSGNHRSCVISYRIEFSSIAQLDLIAQGSSPTARDSRIPEDGARLNSSRVSIVPAELEPTFSVRSLDQSRSFPHQDKITLSPTYVASEILGHSVN